MNTILNQKENRRYAFVGKMKLPLEGATHKVGDFGKM